MKITVISTIVLCALTITSIGAAYGQKNNQIEKTWYNCSFDEDGVYGAEVDMALDFLKGKKRKKTPVIALIGVGMDIEHEAIKHAIWTNPKEKPDGKDNDKNLYVDDIHGWNFLMGKDGSMLANTNMTSDREFYRLRGKYSNLFYWPTEDYYIEISDEGNISEVAPPENIEEFRYFQRLWREGSIGFNKRLWLSFYNSRAMLRRVDQEMRKQFPDKKLTRQDFGTVVQSMQPDMRQHEKMALASLTVSVGMHRTDDWDTIFSMLQNSTTQDRYRDSYQKGFDRADFGARQRILGDAPNDITDYPYGNNNVFTFQARADVMKAGIIAGKRNNGIGVDGIADFAKIMSLVTCAETGEPYTKDMALAIRYAVEKGADIIVLAFQSKLYSPLDQTVMYEALRYAEKKGALVIVPTGQSSSDVDKTAFFPNRFMGENELTNFMTVSISDKQGKPSQQSNYGAQGIDLFAPGIDIYVADVGDTYQNTSSSQLGAGVVAGVAALVKGYYPHLTGSQLRKLLIENVTLRKEVNVEKVIMVEKEQKQVLLSFEELCFSGGIVSAYKAVLAADKMKK